MRSNTIAQCSPLTRSSATSPRTGRSQFRLVWLRLFAYDGRAFPLAVLDALPHSVTEPQAVALNGHKKAGS